MPKISALPIANSAATGDLLVLDQGSITKRIDFNVLQSAVANAGVVQSLITQGQQNINATNVTASAGVVTPRVSSPDVSTPIQFFVGSSHYWDFTIQGGLQPQQDNNNPIGDPGHRVSEVFTPVIDTGSLSSGTLKTNNGTTVLIWANDGTITPATNYRSTDGSLGMTSNIIVGAKVMVIKNGIITSFA